MAKNAVQTVRAALCLVLALAVANCALAGRVLDEQVAAPLPADPLPAPTDPPTDPVVAPAAGLAAASGAAGAASAGATTTGNAGATGAGVGDHPLTFFTHDILGGS